MDRQKFGKLFDLGGRTALVTGGTRGIGLALAEAFVCAGANVVVAGRKPDACAAAAAHLTDMGGRALGVPTHMGDLKALDALVTAAAAEFGGIDILVNNAANPSAQPLGEMTTAAWEKSYDVNLRGPVFLVQAALPHLERSSHAAILNIVSVGAFTFSPGTAIYSAAKAAMVSFTRSMAAEFAPRGIRVNALAPGPVNTSMVRNNPPEFVAALERSTLQRRIADPDEMVGAALLLTSDAGSYITGQTVIADGGLIAR
ncbi:SDR family NAD(P)-dependent oxidoreductase [Nocardia sp. CDC160]|uniref:SDR family NAD(P)-dependent oxidoreductase n=1 Tax=Nocardia sp. CDC160 TaxID=3112166 RepID=UPI002DBC5667|nr:SDR family oxidoreductase [Nocardia sp. CDC160]MEC3915484.1 SDR family oxidoreductase [Nocardia sp. CDC160]